jgi:hypothetical protein
MGIVGMLNGAKNGRKLYEDMRAAGYADEEFPDWWYSPARETSRSDKLDVVHPRETSRSDKLGNDSSRLIEI